MRLVGADKLLPFDGDLQLVGLPLQLFRLPPQGGRTEGHLLPPLRLGAVERKVRIPQQPVAIEPFALGPRDPDAQAHAAFVPLIDRRGRDVGDQPFGKAHKFGVIGRFGQEDREFVAAHPRRKGARDPAVAQERRRMPQHMVARVMAKDVVDLLEPVKVEEQKRGRPRLRAAGGMLRLLHLFKITPVRKPVSASCSALYSISLRAASSSRFALFGQKVGQPERIGPFVVVGDVEVQPDQHRTFRRILQKTHVAPDEPDLPVRPDDPVGQRVILPGGQRGFGPLTIAGRSSGCSDRSHTSRGRGASSSDSP